MKDIIEMIKDVAKDMKATVPIGPPLHQIKKLIEVLEERKSTQLKFDPKREKHWQGNYNRLIALKAQITDQP